MAIHTLLQRQIKRHLAGIDTSAEPWSAFLEAVHSAYAGFDTDREMVDRAMDLSSSELVEANGQLRAIIQAFPDLILQIDDAGVIVTSRGTACGLFAQVERLEGRPLPELLPAAVVPEFERALGKTASARTVAAFTFVHGAGLQTTAYEVRLAPLPGANAIVLIRDVTQQQRVDEMRVAKEAAEAANEARSRFLANVSHELRTPLNAVIGYSEMLKEEAVEAGLDAQVHDLSRITTAGRHVLQIVNDLLDISKIDAGRMTCDIEHVDLAPVIDEVMASVKPMAEARGNHLQSTVASGAVRLRTDAIKLRQILLNLLSNACKFTDGGTVALAVRPDADDPRQLIFSVTDTGMGMDPDRLGQLFKDFVQFDDSATRRHGGTGLGLSITRRMCGLLGGRIDVESAVGKGSTFLVWLPIEGPIETEQVVHAA